MQQQVNIGAVMVVGAGIGGIQAALNLAESGYKVYLVEKTPAIGGTMAQLDKTFPTNDCAMCILSPKLVECGRHLNIEIMTCAEIEDIKGTAGNFQVAVKKNPRYIDIKKCTGCGDCATVCPVEIPSEFDQGLAIRKAIYRPFAQAFPGAFAISKRGRPPCKLTCPANVDVQGYVALIGAGKYSEALALIKETLPLPGVLGRICTHPCELECYRKAFDEPISICTLKRFAADNATVATNPPVKAPKNIKVAIIGAGPAGLAAAYFLAREGYQTTVFEALPVVGGMLAVGIPEYRLPRQVLTQEVNWLKNFNIEIKTNTCIGKDLTIDDLFRQGYRAVFIATGAHLSQKMGVPGEEAAGVISGVTFLKQVNLGQEVKIGEKVTVIGGGNVAIDAARSALRRGAREVSILYRRTRAEMPASTEEIEAAEAEGIKLTFLVNPTAVLSSNGQVKTIRCIRMELGEPDVSGRRRPVPIPSSEFDIPVDTVIPAIGQAADLTFATPESGIIKAANGALEIDPVTLATSRAGVFAGGDLQSGPATAVEAIAGGHKAALSILRFLEGEDVTPVSWPVTGTPVPFEAVTPPVERAARLKFAELPVEQRVGSFAEVNLGFTEEEARLEAKRCLNCGICSECQQCVATCKATAINHHMIEETVQVSVGSVILAPGFDKFNPSAMADYSYGISPNVVTSSEFERILSASGPYQGKLTRPGDKQTPKRIAWLQCIGSRDASIGHDYCSSVCCTYAIKEAMIAKEHAGADLETTIFYMDIRTFGKGFDDFYRRGKDEHKIRFVKSRVYSITEVPETGNLIVRYSTEDGQLQKEEFDMVVLSVGFQPSAKAVELAQRAGVKLNKYGFCQTSDFSLIETTAPGIFVTGACQAPRDIPETVVQACAAAASSAALLNDVRNTAVLEKIYPPEIEVTATEAPRIGVFICHCGLNIGGVIDVPQVKEYIAKIPGVVFADDNLYTCSQDTQNKIKEKIAEYRLNRVVVASCSPRTHEPLFQETIREAGLNRFLFEMANIRDQCSWVHMHEPVEATQKAKELLHMAVARAARLEPLHKVTLGLSHDALVIGGGVAGMTAALNLAQQGFRVCLIERENELGGWARKVTATAEGLDVSALLTTLINSVRTHELIEVLTGTNLVKTEGFIGNFKSTLQLAEGQTQRLVEHGVTVVATGATEYRGKEYLLGQDARIITLSDFEEHLARVPEEAGRATNVAMILCARPVEMNYCSRVCCTTAIKNALKLKELNPKANIYIFYKDVRTYGFKEELYTKARQAGILFIHYTDEKPPNVSLVDGLINLEAFEPILGETFILKPDLLVLAAPMVPSKTNADISGILKVPLTKEGFFHEAHVKLAPVDFASEGIFMCGTAHSPKFIDEAVAQALAAAGRAATILAKKQLDVGGAISQIDAEKCKACLTCVRICPYSVPHINAEGVAEIDVAKCRGCGVCAAECPRQAIKLLHYKQDQVSAKTEVLLIGAE